MIKDVLVTPLDIIESHGGEVMHAMKKSSAGYLDFGEAYFSNINFNAVKAWKRHKEMTLNIVVPVGEIKFVLFDDRSGAKNFQQITLSRGNYCRLTIPPMIWVGFQGMAENGSILLNISDIEHNPTEADKKNIEEIEFNWRLDI